MHLNIHANFDFTAATCFKTFDRVILIALLLRHLSFWELRRAFSFSFQSAIFSRNAVRILHGFILYFVVLQMLLGVTGLDCRQVTLAPGLGSVLLQTVD